MTSIVVKGITGSPAEITLFSDANITNHSAAVSGTVLNVVYTKNTNSVVSLKFTNHDKSLLGSWPSVGYHIDIPTKYTPTDYAPFVCKPAIVTVGNIIHVLWAYFVKRDGYTPVTEIGTGYSGSDISIESVVSYGGLFYSNPTTVLTSSMIDSDVEVDLLIAGVPGITPGTWITPPALVEIINPNSMSGTHHGSNVMVVEYFFSGDSGITWLSELIVDKVDNSDMIYTGVDFALNTSTSDDSGALYLALAGYNDITSVAGKYDNFLSIIKGNLNHWSYEKRYNTFSTQSPDAIYSPSITTYPALDSVDFIVSVVSEPASTNTNHNLDLLIPDYNNDINQRYLCIEKCIASTFSFPPDEPLPDPIPVASANTMSSVIRNAYADKPFGKIEITSAGDIWSGGWARTMTGLRTSPHTTIYAAAEFVTIGIGHIALFNEQIVKSGASAPYIWYRVKKPNASNVRPLSPAYAVNALNSGGSIATAVLSGELQVVHESEIFPANGLYGCLELYSSTGQLTKQLDPSSWPVYGTPRAASEAKIIRDFVIDKNDNLWISYGYDNYAGAPQHWCLGFYNTTTDSITPILCAASQSNTMQPAIWQIYNTNSKIYTSSSVEAYSIASPGNETVALLTARLKANVEYVTGLPIGNPSLGVLVLPAGYTWTNLEHQGPGYFNNTFAVNITKSGLGSTTLTITGLSAPSDSNGAWFLHDSGTNGGTTSSRLTASKDGSWVAYHGFVHNVLGSTDCILFDVDVTLPSAPNLANYPAGSKAPHIRITLPGADSQRACVDALHIDNDIAWMQTASNGGIGINQQREVLALHRIPLPTGYPSATQYIPMSTGEANFSHIATNEPGTCNISSPTLSDKFIINTSARLSSSGNRANIVSDDDYVYVMYNHTYYTLCVNIYDKQGRFYKRTIVKLPDAYINTYTFYNAHTVVPGGSNHITMANYSGLSSHTASSVRATIDDNGTIVYCGTYEFNRLDLLKTSNVKLLSYHHSFSAGNVNSNSEFTNKTASTSPQHYVYVGASWETATKKAKLLEINPTPTHIEDPDYTSDDYDNACIVVEKVLGEFVAGDLIKEYNGTSDTNSHAILIAGECDYTNTSAYLLDSYSPHLVSNLAQPAWANCTASQVYKDGTLYVSNNTKEIKTYTSAVVQTEEIIVSSVCTTNGSIDLLLDDKTKSGRGAAVSFNKVGTVLSDPFANIPGTGYSIGDIVFIGTTAEYATFSVTSIDSNGGITGISMSTDSVLANGTYLQGGIYNSYNVKNFCVVTVNLDTTNHSSINNVAAAMRDAINLSGLAVAVASNEKVTISHKSVAASYSATYNLSNNTGVTFKINQTKQATKAPTPIPASNILTVSHTLTESIPSRTFNRIRDALEYAETTGTAGSWYTLLVHPGTWYEDVRPNPSGTTQKCNYVIKAVSEDLQYQSSLRTGIAGFRTKYPNTVCTRTATGLTLPINLTSHGLKAPDSITVTSTTNAAYCPAGTYTVTRTSANQFTIDTGVSAASGTSVTIQFTINVDNVPSNPNYPKHGRGLIEIKESGILNSNRVMVFEGLVITNAYVPTLVSSPPETGARYLMKRLHPSSIESAETVIYNKCCIYNQWEAITAPGDANDTHFFNSRGYGYIQNTTAINTFTAVYYNSIMGRSNLNDNPTFFTNDSGSLSADETINIYNVGSSFRHGLSSLFNNHVNYTHALKSINSSGLTHYAIGNATNNTSAITQQPIGNVYGHSSILSHASDTASALYGGYYYIDAVNWFDDAGSIQSTIPSDVHISMINRSWTPRE